MTTKLQLYIYLIILLAAFIISLARYLFLDTALKMIAILLGFTIIIEVLAAYMAKNHHNNLGVYHIYTPVAIILTLLYFHFLHPQLRKWRIIPILIGVSIVAFVLNTVFLEPMDKVLDSNMMLFSELITAAFCLYTLYILFSSGDTGFKITSSSRFWISMLFLFFCCSTFILWSTLQILRATGRHSHLYIAYDALWIVNIIFYSGFGTVFYFIPKLTL